MASSLRIDETVPASKVVHFRNLPEQCSHEDLIELCSPFGKVVNLLCNVGPNKNQGFAEFADINEATSMVSNYASSPDRVQLHGRNIYVQYSDRPEIVVTRFAKGNILLVTMEDVKAGDVSIDSMRSVFSVYGFVQKISTFEKNAGFQALIQFADIESASTAKEALDGKKIPRSLLPDRISDCNFHIAYSGHRDLNIKFQSNRSRDYTDATLPVNQATIARALQPIPRTADNHVLLVSFENLVRDVTLDVLHGVFSEIGTVHKIYIFRKNGRTHALIQYHDVATAKAAKNILEGHCIYDDGSCKIHLAYSRHNDINVKPFGDKSKDYSKAEQTVAQVPATAWQNPHAISMNPNAYPYCYMCAPATFPEEAYGYGVGQSNPMVYTTGYLQITPDGVPAFSPQMQPFLGFLPIQPYYYGY
ncbi:polypyrimidine tract-binding protein homolog 1-like [Vigna radiata var. radiata]|uniref:Polypyrimidine tract-binding protein homolog 1-like n=1 Tax=Vigna radiata var. radiata TaxID=3916 RepID=A0A3Q0FI68_VIGRR|nr:polypyrimidine tract-binding protein homolog 1-like [Vigna radiata var. radiata]